MQDYMRGIGFSRMDKYELNNVLKSVIDEPKCEYITDGDDAVIAERSREFAERIGITVCGEYDKDGIFLKEYYFPYIRGEEVSVIEEISVEKLPDRTSYIGVSDDISRDISLAFYLLNRVDYIDNRQYAKRDRALKPIVLSALSISGRIIMPIYKNEAMMKKSSAKRRIRNNLINAARHGDEEAIENLTLEDFDLFTTVSKRAKKIDVFTLVETCFMPYGISSDEYYILGNIIGLKQMENQLTKEKLYVIKLECNELVFDLCINQEDVLGEPMVGRRFKGKIWLQGNVEFVTV